MVTAPTLPSESCKSALGPNNHDLMTANRVVLIVLISCLFAGCGGNRTAPVNGRVKFTDGGDVSVLAGHTISLQTEGDRISAYGDVQPDGTFRLTTYGANDGAVPGHHQVAISPPPPPPDAPPPKPIIAKKYGDFATSGLSVEIKPGQNRPELELERAK